MPLNLDIFYVVSACPSVCIPVLLERNEISYWQKIKYNLKINLKKSSNWYYLIVHVLGHRLKLKYQEWKNSSINGD